MWLASTDMCDVAPWFLLGSIDGTALLGCDDDGFCKLGVASAKDREKLLGHVIGLWDAVAAPDAHSMPAQASRMAMRIAIAWLLIFYQVLSSGIACVEKGMRVQRSPLMQSHGRLAFMCFTVRNYNAFTFSFSYVSYVYYCAAHATADMCAPSRPRMRLRPAEMPGRTIQTKFSMVTLVIAHTVARQDASAHGARDDDHGTVARLIKENEQLKCRVAELQWVNKQLVDDVSRAANEAARVGVLAHVCIDV